MLDLLLNLANRFHFQEGEGKGSSGMRKIFFVLRIIQLICAITVIALMGYYVQNFALIISATSKGRTQVFYTISINAIFVGVDALACVLIFYSGVYTFWILEMLHVPVLFFVAWYLLWDYISTMPCGTNIWDWSEVAEQDMCGHWKAAMAFSFIEAFIWMVGGVLACVQLRKFSKWTDDDGMTRRNKKWLLFKMRRVDMDGESEDDEE